MFEILGMEKNPKSFYFLPGCFPIHLHDIKFAIFKIASTSDQTILSNSMYASLSVNKRIRKNQILMQQQRQ